ncbi:hypothetical protein [Paenibacillus cymbidii]|uniref:hypothetical protein n=1 Tax=Paenibacillus cymbidii TaxID=1639034 RepID=UPI0010806E23|nr:hypothetical protein [Paenibacillus cymbidii]
MHSERQLTDTERKILQILWNCNHNTAIQIDLAKLELYSGRKKPDILNSLRELAATHYVEWEEKTLIAKVIQLPGIQAPGRPWGAWPD